MTGMSAEGHGCLSSSPSILLVALPSGSSLGQESPLRKMGESTLPA